LFLFGLLGFWGDGELGNGGSSDLVGMTLRTLSDVVPELVHAGDLAGRIDVSSSDSFSFSATNMMQSSSSGSSSLPKREP
jgi:hypothetical protein